MRYILIILLIVMVSGCGDKEKEMININSIKDVFDHIDIGTDIATFNNQFTKKPNGKYELFIDGFHVEFDISNGKVKRVQANRELNTRGASVVNYFKELRSSIFYDRANQGGAQIFNESTEGTRTHKSETFRNEYCTNIIYGDNYVYLKKDNGERWKLYGFGGREGKVCDTRRAAREWAMEESNGSINIEIWKE